MARKNILYTSNRCKDIYHSERMCEDTKEKVIKRIEAASLLLDIIKKCNLPFKRNIQKLPGWEDSLL
ncbi:hypothetical protein [Caldicellulosiruptor naganoensis]|uniref:Uncharacterized protein n=1 Tax=Caldicellulosiruptor naganoensis TaxID=29324 RepID=A0ABY7BEI3_9FIRM|nr:hypothetical protein [Caldicellulosiruptor naganoensis]WAM31234.1 hypothetical protein OTJ99_002068 [Caldicellulosiruptor naganoensis]